MVVCICKPSLLMEGGKEAGESPVAYRPASLEGSDKQTLYLKVEDEEKR